MGFTTEKGKQRETLYTVLKSKVLTREESGSEGHSALPTTQPRAVCNVTSAPTSSEIQIDGEFVGNTPAKVVLPVGKHMIKLSSFGYKEWVREISVTDGSELTVGPTLEKQ